MKYISEEKLRELFDQYKAVAELNCNSMHFDGMLDMLEMVIDECQELNQWQPIDTAPKDRRVLLFYSDIKQQFAGAWSINHRSFDTQTIIFGRGEPTHWQELPEDPE